MASLRKMAGGVAHDFNNLLTVILGNANLMLLDLPETSPFLQNVGDIISAAERAASLADQMLVFSGRRQLHMQRLDLGTLLADAKRRLSGALPPGVRLSFNLSPSLPPIWGDAGQLGQLLDNLVCNAQEAMTQGLGGTIQITTRLTELREADRPRLRPLNAVWRPGQWILLSISDDGAGMEEALLGHIFDPFFTTKFTGRGLGLSVVQGILEAHRGMIEIDSRPGRGTRIHLYFPFAAEADL